MIELMKSLPSNVIGFRATGEVTAKDYREIVFPEIEKQAGNEDKLNYIFVIDTSLSEFTTGAWINDVWLGLKEAAKWRRVAIVSDVEKIRQFTDKAGHFAPGEYKGFRSSELNDAILWAAEPEKIASH
jgi:hypothetical protein